MNDYEETLKSANPMDRVLLSYSWTKYYEDFDNNTEKYKKVFQKIEEKTRVKFNIFHHTYVQKVALSSKNRFCYAIDDVKESFIKENEREMFPPEIKNFYFTLIWVKCIRDAIPITSYGEFPVYVFPAIAEAIIEYSPAFFNGINVQIIKNTWE